MECIREKISEGVLLDRCVYLLVLSVHTWTF